MQNKERYIQLNKELLKNTLFDSVEEFRTLFYMIVENEVFDGSFTKSEDFDKEAKLFVFKFKEKINNKRYESYKKGLIEKGFTPQKLGLRTKSFITLSLEEVGKIKGTKQLYALFLKKWQDQNANIYFEKDVLYRWFCTGKNGEVNKKQLQTAFKRAMEGIGLPQANYKIEGNKLTIFRGLQTEKGTEEHEEDVKKIEVVEEQPFESEPIFSNFNSMINTFQEFKSIKSNHIEHNPEPPSTPPLPDIFGIDDPEPILTHEDVSHQLDMLIADVMTIETHYKLEDDEDGFLC